MTSARTRCFAVFNIWGFTIGSTAGIAVGAFFLGFIGILLGAMAGIAVGVGVGTLLAVIFCKDFPGVVPQLQSVTLAGAPQARVGVPYRAELRWTVVGNTDRLVCTVVPKIQAPNAAPPESPAQSFDNNATDFGRAIAQDFVFARPSDRERLFGDVVLTVTKDGRSATVSKTESLSIVVVP